jgi:hypothetical protein
LFNFNTVLIHPFPCLSYSHWLFLNANAIGEIFIPFKIRFKSILKTCRTEFSMSLLINSSKFSLKTIDNSPDTAKNRFLPPSSFMRQSYGVDLKISEFLLNRYEEKIKTESLNLPNLKKRVENFNKLLDLNVDDTFYSNSKNNIFLREPYIITSIRPIPNNSGSHIETLDTTNNGALNYILNN